MEKDILELIKNMNACWTEGHPEDLVYYFHEKMVAITPANRFRLEGRVACLAGWVGFSRSTDIKSWREYDHIVNIFGESAVVSYYYDIEVEMDGKAMTLSGRDMLMLIKKRDRWWVVADQFSPFPAQSD